MSEMIYDTILMMSSFPGYSCMCMNFSINLIHSLEYFVVILIGIILMLYINIKIIVIFLMLCCFYSILL